MAQGGPTLWARVKALLGVSAYQPQDAGYGPKLDDRAVEEARKALGGIIQQIPVTRLRWYLRDLENAQAQADAGFLGSACQLYRSMQRDGKLAGLLASRTSSVVHAPKRYFGLSREIIDSLRAVTGPRSVFDEMCPPSELKALDADGIAIGVGVAELVPVEGRDYPVLVRLDPEFLQFVWAESRWYYLSRVGRIPITPGDGRWVLHIPEGRVTPWRWGLWPALGRAFINKEHAVSMRAGFIASIANPARVMETPLGASENERRKFFSHVLNWGPSTVLEVPAGWQVKLLEVIGRAWEVFQKEIDTCDQEYYIALTAQLVATTGGAGFQNTEVPERRLTKLIQADGEALAYTVNTQILPQYVVDRWGIEALDAGTAVCWQIAEAKDLEAESRTMGNVGTALKAIAEALALYGRRANIEELAARFSLPLESEEEQTSEGIPEQSRPAAVRRLELVDQTREGPQDTEAAA